MTPFSCFERINMFFASLIVHIFIVANSFKSLAFRVLLGKLNIFFKRSTDEIPGHEVFGVLEADFLPVKAAWIEYERRSVLFQLVMKAMRMAVHKYYYEIQTTYVFPLSFFFVSLSHTHTHKSTQQVHILPHNKTSKFRIKRLEQECHDRYRSFTRQAHCCETRITEKNSKTSLSRDLLSSYSDIDWLLQVQTSSLDYKL